MLARMRRAQRCLHENAGVIENAQLGQELRSMISDFTYTLRSEFVVAICDEAVQMRLE